MPKYTFEVFRFTGTEYNATYNTSYQATFTDDDGAYQGGGDVNEQVQIGDGAATSTLSVPYTLKLPFVDTNGNSHVEDFNFFYAAGDGWYFAPASDSNFTVGATLGTLISIGEGWNYEDVVCFVSGTMIATPDGARAIETLAVSDLVDCQNNGAKPIVQILTRSFSKAQLQDNEKLRPVRITAGSLGLGLPTSDLMVSRQHRMVIKSKISKRLFGTEESLVSAIRLTKLPGIYLEPPNQGVTYYHLGFESHEVIFAQGAPAESLLQGGDNFLDNNSDAREELTWLLPNAYVTPKKATSKLPIPSGKTQNEIVSKHVEKKQALRT